MAHHEKGDTRNGFFHGIADLESVVSETYALAVNPAKGSGVAN